MVVCDYVKTRRTDARLIRDTQVPVVCFVMLRATSPAIVAGVRNYDQLVAIAATELPLLLECLTDYMERAAGVW